KTNVNYSINAYVKGAIFLNQLGYVIGKENLDNTLKRYFREWKFKHPTPNDFIRVAEKVSGAQLIWYLNDWTRTTNKIYYGIKRVESDGNKTKITLERNALMPMPLDLSVSYSDGSSKDFYIPYRRMYRSKPLGGDVEVLDD